MLSLFQFTSPGSNIQLLPGTQLLPQLLPNDNDNDVDYDVSSRGGNPANCRYGFVGTFSWLENERVTRFSSLENDAICFKDSCIFHIKSLFLMWALILWTFGGDIRTFKTSICCLYAFKKFLFT